MSLDELDRIIVAREAGISLVLAPEVEALIRRAVAHRGTPPDIEAWARRLAEEIADLKN